MILSLTRFGEKWFARLDVAGQRYTHWSASRSLAFWSVLSQAISDLNGSYRFFPEPHCRERGCYKPPLAF